MAQIPTVGRVVLFKLNSSHVEQINRRRGHAALHMDDHRANSNGVMVHVGNTVHAGDVFPMVIARVWGNEERSLVNGQVLLDGSDTFWACSVGVGDEAGMWSWPVIQTARVPMAGSDG